MFKTSPKVRRVIINESPKDLVNTLCECVLNILKGNVPLKPIQKRRLSKYKGEMRKLINKRVSTSSKKRLLQKGGLFGILAKVLAPLITPLLGGLFGKDA
jgi:hypothetical protein